MEGPPAKRQRRSKPGAGLSKRARDPEDATTPVKRSRKRANSEAEGLLASGCAVSGEKVLRVLRSWKFSENVSRVNVMPRDAHFVLSDTLGLVCTRTGAVSVSRLTNQYPAVFQVLCAWLRHAWPLADRFPFTSISVNCNYAAQRHRDCGNVGPSLTKAFGEFCGGGALRYWGEDDGCLSLDQLGQFSATSLESGHALCLFDGRRAHSVQAFRGERYSLVFFSTSAFARARGDVLAFVSSLGAQVPTSASLQRAARYLAPAKGYSCGKQQRGIREMCGQAARPTFRAWITPSLLNIESSCLDTCLSFLISPALMSSLCAVAKAISIAAHRQSSWRGTIVDAEGCRPKGKLALTHFTSWSLTRAVVGGTWEKGSLSFLVSRTWQAWSFTHTRETRVLVSRLPVPSNDATVLFSANRAFPGKIFVGMSTHASCQGAITSALNGRPMPGVVVVAAALSSARCKAFRCNGKAFGPTVTPVDRFGGIVRFSLDDRCRATIAVQGRKAAVSAKIPLELAPGSAPCFFFVLLPAALRPDEVKPCWIRMRA